MFLLGSSIKKSEVFALLRFTSDVLLCIFLLDPANAITPLLSRNDGSLLLLVISNVCDMMLSFFRPTTTDDVTMNLPVQ